MGKCRCPPCAMGWRGVLRAGLCLILAAPCVEAKVQVSAVYLSKEQRWGYVSKFGYAPGNGSYALRLRVPPQPRRVEGNVSVRFETYLDEDWNGIQAREACARNSAAKRSWTLSLRPDGQWSEVWQGTVRNTVRSHVWYFVLVHCTGQLKDGNVRFEYEIQHMNEGGSHFSVETRWTLPSNVLSLLFFMAFCLLFARRCLSEKRAMGKLHAVIWALVAVVGLELAAQSLHALHLLRYSQNGSGLKFVEVLAEILFILSQLVQSTLLILIGYGYTLLPVDLSPELVLLAVGVGAVVHIILVLLIKGEEAADKFHDYESVAGKILLALRLLLFVAFLWALRGTVQGAPFRIRRFLTSFGLVGTLYFIGPPLLVLIVSLFAPYWRPPILTTCLILLQIGTAWWLNRLFLSRGEYFEVSELNSSSLPGGTPRSNTPRNSPRYDRDKHD